MLNDQKFIGSVIRFEQALKRVASNSAGRHPSSWQHLAQYLVLHRRASRAAAIVIAISLPLWFGYATSIPAEAAPSLPTGFSLVYTSTPLGGASSYNLTDIKYVPQSTGVEAGLFAAGKDGKIAWVPNIGSGRLLATIPNVRSDSDAG